MIYGREMNLKFQLFIFKCGIWRTHVVTHTHTRYVWTVSFEKETSGAAEEKSWHDSYTWALHSKAFAYIRERVSDISIIIPLFLSFFYSSYFAPSHWASYYNMAHRNITEIYYSIYLYFNTLFSFLADSFFFIFMIYYMFFMTPNTSRVEWVNEQNGELINENEEECWKMNFV